MENEKNYYLGLDIGTDSIGWAATDKNYNLLKFKGEPMWGVHLFEEAHLNEERRLFRSARRRLDRRQWRIRLLQELFAKEITEVDEKFFIRIKESFLFPEDTTDGAMLFKDKNFTDVDYHTDYPTIHHLIYELISNSSPHDIRLVYLACAWLVAHRGHFLNEIDKEKVDKILDFNSVYKDLTECFPDGNEPWTCNDTNELADKLKQKVGITQKYRDVSTLLYGKPKVPKECKNSDFPYDTESMLKLLCGGKVAPSTLFKNDEYKALESFDLGKDEDDLAPILGGLGDDAELIRKLKAVYDWALLSDILQGEQYISKAKINVYEQHKEDLGNLKYLLKKYTSRDTYREVFGNKKEKSDGEEDKKEKKSKKNIVNYEMYAKGSSSQQEDFCKYVKKFVEIIEPSDEDREIYEKVMTRIESNVLCPKQINSDNRVIPYQVYWIELKAILNNAEKYLPFLKIVENGITVSDKIISLFEFRVPYFVGPLNNKSEYSWVKKYHTEKIYPWNFEKSVDYEESEKAFIDRMTNSCTYLPGEDVLPKMSLCYQRFQLLNEINPISVNGRNISVEVKQKLFKEVFEKRKKVSVKQIKDYLLSNNLYTEEELETLSGIDITVKSSLTSYKAFENLLNSGKLKETDVERIIEIRTYTESKSRFSKWLDKEYPTLSEEDRKYISQLKFKDFGRLSRKFLCDFYGTESDSDTGEAKSILDRMWDENITLMEALSDKYTYKKQIRELEQEYYSQNPKTLDERLSEMYISNPVKRPIIRTLDIVRDVVKANGHTPEKIFVEMARGGRPEEKGKRTNSRYTQITELYDKCKEDVRELTRELEAMGDKAETKLQSDKLFLYYMQLGRCMYTGERIDLSTLSSKTYDIDHIYPYSKSADDSLLNNKVLVLSKVNGDKGDVYPIKAEIRNKMGGWWKSLHESGHITDEKYKRLIRKEAFGNDELQGFVNRQLVETRQSTKAVASILNEFYPDTEIIYVKAGRVSDFRHSFDILKSRSVNDLHHAKDAYLNIAVGNVYHEKFTKKWFFEDNRSYTLNPEKIFSHKVKNKSGDIIWKGSEDIQTVKNTAKNKNAIHLTRYAFCRKGGLFDQQPVKAAEGLVPLKKGLPTEKYGGYNKPAASFFMLVKYSVGKKTDLMFMPVELLYADKALSSPESAEEYAKRNISSIINKEVQSVSFPLGMRKIKIGTVLEFDGTYRAYITGKASGGKKIGLSTFRPLIVGYEWEKYIKRLEVLCEKKKNNKEMIYSEEYDIVNISQNEELYDILTEKLQTAAYKGRPANPCETLISGKETFKSLDIFEQSNCLLQIIILFGRISGSDLRSVGGSASTGVTGLSSFLSNWKKYYSDVRIKDTTASGLFKTESRNLLELL